MRIKNKFTRLMTNVLSKVNLINCSYKGKITLHSWKQLKEKSVGIKGNWTAEHQTLYNAKHERTAQRPTVNVAAAHCFKDENEAQTASATCLTIKVVNFEVTHV